MEKNPKNPRQKWKVIYTKGGLTTRTGKIILLKPCRNHLQDKYIIVIYSNIYC